jgi:DNA-binding transcriptional LysR family regulator
MILKFRELEVFWAAYKSQSVKDAARDLNVSQPAVSMMLKSAEERFGIQLFDRSGGRIKPTPEADALFTATNNVFIELEELKRQLERIKEGRAGIVRLAATPTLAAAFLHPALLAFRRRHPDIRVIMRTATTSNCADLVLHEQADLGLVYGPTAMAGTTTEDIAVSEVACVFHKAHRLAAKRLIRPADLKGETLMTYRQDTQLGREIQKMLRGPGAELKLAAEVTALMACYVANAGDCAALVDPFIMNGGLFPNLVVRRFAPTTTARVQIVTRRDEPLSLLTQDFLLEIRRSMPRHFSLSIPIDGETEAPPGT